MSLGDVALDCIARGWHIFPCKPRAKDPLIRGGFHAATADQTQVRDWWSKWPDANVGIATGASGLTVLDIDEGIQDSFDLAAFVDARKLPRTLTVRTGRRPGFGVQLYYETGSEALRSIPWVDPDRGVVHGDIRGGTGYVLAAGSLHPSGAFYEALVEAPIAPVPEYVRALKSPSTASAIAALRPDEKIRIGRHDALMSMGGSWRSKGMPAEALADAMLATNAARVDPPLEEDDVLRMAANISKFAIHDDGPEVIIGTAKAEPVGPKDWRLLFHTRDETENTPDPEFLIEGFLQVESVTGIIGPARARKSIVVVNIIRALLTGEPLFGHFEVSNRPERVIYLCPESGLKSLAKRIRNMGLSEFVGDTLFYTSMNSDRMTLTDPGLRRAARGAVVIIDTAIRFFNGNENDSQDMKVLGEHCHGLIRDGVAAVVLLHHTSKNTEALTLESGRGSGDFGGFLTCCWGTTLEDYDDAYKSLSHMSCVKQRDFQADRFNVAPSGDPDDFNLRYVVGSENVVLAPKTRFKANKDGKDDAATALLKAHPKLSLRELVELLGGHGIKRGKDWIQKHRRGGVELADSPG